MDVHLKMRIRAITVVKPPKTVDEYILAWDETIRKQLEDVRQVLISRLPDATEKISWSMPTYWKDHNIIHFAAQKKHIGLYPGPEAVEHFSDKLNQAGLKYNKGSIQIPYSDELPLQLISGDLLTGAERPGITHNDFIAADIRDPGWFLMKGD